MISASLCASSSSIRAMPGFLRRGLVVALLIPRALAAQTAPSDLQSTVSLPGGTCDSLAPDTPHSDALRKVCEYAVTLPLVMPNFTCEQKTSSENFSASAAGFLGDVVYPRESRSYEAR